MDKQQLMALLDDASSGNAESMRKIAFVFMKLADGVKSEMPNEARVYMEIAGSWLDAADGKRSNLEEIKRLTGGSIIHIFG
jgi:hypothetical protein